MQCGFATKVHLAVAPRTQRTKPISSPHIPYLAAVHQLSTSCPFVSTAASHSASHSCMMSCQTSAASASPSSRQLLVLGPGVLGSRLGKLWLDEHGEGVVTGETKTTNNHAALRALGFKTRTTTDAAAPGTFPYVAYAAPPSGSEDYVGDVKAALRRWDGSGNFVFTSSAGVFAVEDGSACDETAPLVPLGASMRTDKLLHAEAAVVEAGGCVVRYVGLYHRTRGAHTFFLKQGQVERWGGYTVNLIHYEDAASLAAAVLRGQGEAAAAAGGTGQYRGEMFLGCDGVPVTFEAMMAAIEASGQLPGQVTFTGKEGPGKGKLVSNATTRRRLGWEPKYAGGLAEFFAAGGQDWYSQEGLPAGAPHA